MKLLQGKLIAEQVFETIKKDVTVLSNDNVIPCLAVILVGHDAASELYVNKKVKQAETLGITVDVYRFKPTVTTEELVAQINNLNRTVQTHGIIVQLPLPESIDANKVVWTIDPKKDVDGFQMRQFRPPAPQAILDLLRYYHVPVLEQRITLVGYGTLVGRPLGVLLTKQGADITICKKDTPNFEEKIKQADIVISAVGKPNLITKNMVKPGQVIVDAGTSSEGGVTAGDVAFDEVAPIVKAITPVPGGVGPLTVAKLLENLVVAARNQKPKPQSAAKEETDFLAGPFVRKRPPTKID